MHVVLALADADPLGVNTNVTFDEVGGLDDRMCLSQIYCLVYVSCCEKIFIL
jgi:hypothetical protein